MNRHTTLLPLLLMLLALHPAPLHAQLWDRLATSDYRTDSTQVGDLRIEVDNLTFFHDNEYSSSLTKGYSLPGLWIQPKLTYTPIQPIQLEVGLQALIFDGASKYPNYAYHDIGTWKGQQYQHGAHVLPWVRAKAQFRHLTLVLGDLYGGQNHQFIEPLFNAETNLSQDPEMGFQLLWDRPYLHADTWLNWQSYIFQNDSHQEAFTVGSNWHVRYNRPQSRVHFYSPVQLVIQHRGGEQDTTHTGVQTLCNVSLGGGVQWNPRLRHLRQAGAQVNLLGTYQQNGHLWPFSGGWALHAQTEANLPCNLRFRAGYFRAFTHFVSLYGNHFFSTLSVRDGQSYNGLHTAYAGVDYNYTFRRRYVVGADAEAFHTWLPGKPEFNFSFGVYIRINPSFLIKKFHE